MDPIILNRRLFFKVAATGVTGYFVSPVPLFPQSGPTTPPTLLRTAKYCIFVLLFGGTSQTDTFDLRVGSWTPPNFSPTTINGADWPAGLMPNLATQFSQGRFSIVRTCQSTALVHTLVQNWTQIARSPTSATGKIAPNIGCVVALEFEPQRTATQKLPGFVALNGGAALAGSGYFAGKYAPFDVTPAPTGVANLQNRDGQTTFNSRYDVLLQADAALRSPTNLYSSKYAEMADFYSSAKLMMYDPAVANVFTFSAEEQARYGGIATGTAFGNACVTARNIIRDDLGTHYIQINQGNWDHHQNIYATNSIYALAGSLDFGLSNLIKDLAELPGANGKSKLDETIIIVKSEFGRSIGNITSQSGRDHYFVHSALFAGGGVRGGRVLGKTTADGAFVEDPGWSAGRPVYSEDIACSIYSALGIDYTKVLTNDPLGRGFEYIPTNTAYTGQPIVELFQ